MKVAKVPAMSLDKEHLTIRETPMLYEIVEATHFITLRRTPFPHVLIEQTLLEMGGGGPEGMAFRKKVLAAAGWPHDGLVPFAKYPDQAAEAFNRVRLALGEGPDADTLLARLTKKT
ncbi:hypothetical protein QF022_000749 [Vogesella perlucida]|nr:hypothetical protein [Vogesella perlucida]